jgi:DNA-binding transcriptional LysR family regulator
MRNISIRKMRVYLAAVEECSFTRASIRENISQPAASIIINQIEESAEGLLFERRGNSRVAKLTSLGVKVAETFSRVVAGYDEELSALGGICSGQRETKLILVQSTFASSLSQAWLNTLTQTIEDSQIKVEICRRQEIIDRVGAREAFLGIVDGEIKTEKLDYSQVGSYKMAMLTPDIMTSTWQANKASVHWKDLPEGAYIMSGSTDRALRQIYENLKIVGRNPVNFHEINCVNLMMKLVLESSRPAVIPDILAPIFPPGFPFQVLPFEDIQVETGFGLITPWGHMSRMKLRALRQIPCFQ